MKISRKSDIIPLLEKGYGLAQIGRMLSPKRAPSTMYAWARELREAGFVLPEMKRGRKKTIEL